MWASIAEESREGESGSPVEVGEKKAVGGTGLLTFLEWDEALTTGEV